jgi:hypothetical protein
MPPHGNGILTNLVKHLRKRKRKRKLFTYPKGKQEKMATSW